MRENPYKYTGPLDPEKDQLICIRRDEEVEKVVAGLKKGDYWAIIGPVQIGKTTFLRQIAYKNRDSYNIYLDLKKSPGETKDFYQWIISQLVDQIPHKSSHKRRIDKQDPHGGDPGLKRNFLNFLKNFKPKSKVKKKSFLNLFKIFQPKVTPVVFLLDEVESISFLDEFLHFWRTIHADRSEVKEYRKYSIVMTGSAKLAEQKVGFSLPFSIPNTLYLEDFSYQQSEQLIDGPFKQLAISIEKKAKEKLINRLSGHPQMLQQTCHFLVQRTYDKDRLLLESDVDDTLAQVLEENPIFYKLEHDIKADKTLQDLIRQVLAGEKISYFSNEEFLAAGTGVIVEGPNSFCAIRNEVFKEFLKGVLIIPEEEEKKKSFEKLLIEKPSKTLYLDNKHKNPMPCAVKQIRVRNYHGIIETGIHLPVDARWVFLTGENAFGKTAVLRAITMGLFGPRDEDKILDSDGKGEIAVEICHNGKNLNNNVGEQNFEPFRYFAAYGSSRLEIQSDRTTGEITGRSTKTYGMFNTDGVSLNIERELVLWYLDGTPRYKERYNTVKEILLELLPHSADITVNREKMEVLYIEKENKENGGSFFDPIPFQKLAAGNKSIIAMIGDLLIRFYREYEKDGKKDIRPVDFEGIVIIDELDLHLHPKWLRKLPGLMSGLFPKIQFIAATHSEIPILGAPKESVLFKVTRNREQGIQIERLDVDFKNLLPHHLLTSPIFELDKIIPEANEKLSDLRTLDNYYESLEIDDIINDLK